MTDPGPALAALAELMALKPYDPMRKGKPHQQGKSVVLNVPTALYEAARAAIASHQEQK